jgi:TBCC domain-containing protein 1
MLGAVAGVLTVESCEEVRVSACCHLARVSNTLDSTCCLFTARSPVVLGDSRAVMFAPFNCAYAQHQRHLQQAQLLGASNCWDCAVNIGSTRSFGLLPPAEFRTLVVPVVAPAQAGTSPSKQQQQQEKQPASAASASASAASASASASAAAAVGQALSGSSPLALPEDYAAAVRTRMADIQGLRDEIKSASLEPAAQALLERAVQANFKEWLLSTGNVRQVLDLVQAPSALATSGD